MKQQRTEKLEPGEDPTANYAQEKFAGTTHANGEKLQEPLPTEARSRAAGALATKSSVAEPFWEDGVEPSWFCFSD